MALNRETTARITDLLVEHPQGLSITDIVKKIDINRNTAGRYLENLLVSGQVEMRHFGMAKIYTLSNRIPQSAMLSISSDLVMQLDSGLRIIFANEPFLKMLGVPSAELFGKNIEYTAAVTVFDDALENFIRHLKNGVLGKEWRSTLTLNNGERIFSCHIYPIAFTDGRKGVSVLLEDVTEFRRYECALHESEDRYRKLVEISTDAVILHSDGKIIYANHAAQKLIGAQYPEDMVGKPVLDFIHPGFSDDVKANIQKDLDGVLSPPIELQMLRLDGTSVTVEGRGVKTLIDGKSAIQVTIRDITDRKLADQAIRESEERYRSLVETTGTGYVILDKDGRVTTANQEYIRLTGRSTLAEIQGRPVTDWTAPYDIERNAHQVEQCFRIGRVRGLEIDYQKPDGTIQPIEINASVIPSGSGYIILTLCRDITERKRAELAVRESEERYRRLLEQSFDAIAIHKNKKNAFLNEKAAKILGAVTPQDLIGRSIFDLIHPDSRRDIEERIRKMSNEHGVPVPVLREKFFRVDGTTVTVEVMAMSFNDNGLPAIQLVFREITSQEII
ncbi:MAG: PAS domain S-box protein [Methanoregula sp.]|nr:PAS domain S-box protein [Methanoregula sp.]